MAQPFKSHLNRMDWPIVYIPCGLSKTRVFQPDRHGGVLVSMNAGVLAQRMCVMSKTIQVTLKKSMIGRPEKHRRVLRGMGLTRVNKTVHLQDSPATRGMIQKVIHLVEAKEASHETE